MPISKELRDNPFFHEINSEVPVPVSQILEIAGGPGNFIFSSYQTEEDTSPFTLHIWDKEIGYLSFTYFYTHQKDSEPYKWFLVGSMIHSPSFALPSVIDSIDLLQNILEMLQYKGVKSVITRSIEASILGKQKSSASNAIINKVFSKKVDPKQAFILDIDQVMALNHLLQNCEGLLPSEKTQLFFKLFRATDVVPEKDRVTLELPHINKAKKCFSITAKNLNDIINIAEPSAELLKSLRELLFIYETKTLAESHSSSEERKSESDSQSSTSAPIAASTETVRAWHVAFLPSNPLVPVSVATAGISSTSASTGTASIPALAVTAATPVPASASATSSSVAVSRAKA